MDAKWTQNILPELGEGETREAKVARYPQHNLRLPPSSS